MREAPDKTTTVTRLLLLPGLGADEVLFDPQRRAYPDLQVPPWVTPEPGETLPAYATRMAQQQQGGPDLVLGGISFGGMVALEMAKLLHPRAVILIASCRSGAAVQPHMRALGRLWCRTPAPLMRPPPLAAPALAWAFGATTPEGRAMMRHFLETRSPAFVKWGLAALLQWRPDGGPACPVFHVHGGADRLIPASRVAANHVVPGAGHLVNVTHAAEVNAFVGRALGN
jgi:pimeloyl-ACP methyl ester carboxylesterase